MKLNREKIADLYEEFLDENDTEGYLPNISKLVIDTICFLVEKNPEVIDIHPNYTTNSTL